MPNLVHSLDASNIHLMVESLNKQPIYTIHDCFATTANNMEEIERLVKEAFIEIYFSDVNYLEKMHKNILDQVKSYNEIKVDVEGKEYIDVKNEKMFLPQIPESFTSKELMSDFVRGIRKSKYFIN